MADDSKTPEAPVAPAAPVEPVDPPGDVVAEKSEEQ